MNIALHYDNAPPFTLNDHEEKGIGGTENFACYVAKALVKAGHTVSFFNRADLAPTDMDGVTMANVFHFKPETPYDVLVSFRMREVFQEDLGAKLKVLILADTESYGLGDDVRAGKIDVVMPVGAWQRDKIAGEEGLEGHACWMDGSNGIDKAEFPGFSPSERKIGMCIHTSTPERGLSLLLDVWPRIQNSTVLTERGINPELHLFSSFLGWGISPEDNEASCADWYPRIAQMVHEGARIINHKHASRDTLRQYQRRADAFLYHTNFNETYCISLTEAMASGAIPIVSNRAALSERIIDGISGTIVGDRDHDAGDAGAKTTFVEKAVSTLFLAESVKNRMREMARDTALRHDYGKLVPEWARIWEARIP